MLEVLETRKLMAGDLNMGSFVIGAEIPVSDEPPAIVQPMQTAHEDSPIAEAIIDNLDASSVDAVLVEDHLIPPQIFLPPCPAQTPNNGSAENSLVGTGVADLTTNDPINTETSDGTSDTSSGTTGSSDRTGASSKTTSEIRVNNPLSAASIHSGILVTIELATDAAAHDSAMGEASRYFTADGSRPSSSGPSLANQSLSPYVQSDTFMAMGLLPSPLTTDQHDDPAFAIQTESHSYQTQSDPFDAWLEREDLYFLREEASAMDADVVVDPVPFRGAVTNPISVAMSSFVGIDFYDVDSNSSENSSLITKINKNRFQFAAFAFVFAVVTVRMNSADYKREKQKLDAARDQKALGTL